MLVDVRIEEDQTSESERIDEERFANNVNVIRPIKSLVDY